MSAPVAAGRRGLAESGLRDVAPTRPKDPDDAGGVRHGNRPRCPAGRPGDRRAPRARTAGRLDPRPRPRGVAQPPRPVDAARRRRPPGAPRHAPGDRRGRGHRRRARGDRPRGPRLGGARRRRDARPGPAPAQRSRCQRRACPTRCGPGAQSGPQAREPELGGGRLPAHRLPDGVPDAVYPRRATPGRARAHPRRRRRRRDGGDHPGPRRRYRGVGDQPERTASARPHSSSVPTRRSRPAGASVGGPTRSSKRLARRPGTIRSRACAPAG